MLALAVPMDDQPISATFFGEGKWLTEFITPENLEVEELYQHTTKGIAVLEDRITALQRYVGGLRYKKLISGTLRVENKTERQNDLWCDPGLTISVGIGNCANKSFLLTSLIRNELGPDVVHCVLGNLHNGKVGGHAWVQVVIDDQEFVIESTRDDVPVFIPVEVAERYEAIHLFNDENAYVVEGRTMMTPFMACYSPWLKDYLNWEYIEGQRRG